jgi:hypothetical protein
VNESPLPDDPAQWPTDPYELLGLPRTVGPRDLRRAYTKLIRTYKPEQFPEQFRRIRAAYETALRMAEFFSARDEPETPVAGGFDKSHVAEVPASRTPSGSPELLPAPRAFDPADDANALWELAAAGHEARAYAGLVDLFRRRPEQTDLPLRLYWLLALDTDLDSHRDPCTWLADALRLSRLAGPAVELYRRELEERPAAAIAAAEPLLAIDAPTDRFAGFLAAHSAAAAGIGLWDEVRADLDRGRDRVRPTDEGSWLRLVLAAIDHIAWEADGQADSDFALDELLADCRREVAALGHLAVKQAEAFDRLDYLLAAAAPWALMRRDAILPSELLDLLPAAWVKPFAEVRPLVADVLAQIVEAPQNWLRHLDTLAARSPTALAFFGGLLAQYQDRLPEPPPVPHAPADLARLAAECLRSDGKWDYRTLRPRLLAFCLREAVGAELVAAVGSAVDEQLTQAIAVDWPLRYVTWASRLAWV